MQTENGINILYLFTEDNTEIVQDNSSRINEEPKEDK